MADPHEAAARGADTLVQAGLVSPDDRDLAEGLLAGMLVEHERLLLREVIASMPYNDGADVPSTQAGRGSTPPALIKPTDDGRLRFTPRR